MSGRPSAQGLAQMAGTGPGGPLHAMAGLGLDRKPHHIPFPPSAPKQGQCAYSMCANANKHECLEETGRGTPRVRGKKEAWKERQRKRSQPVHENLIFKEKLLLTQAHPLAEHLLTSDTLWSGLVPTSLGDAFRDQILACPTPLKVPITWELLSVRTPLLFLFRQISNSYLPPSH